MSPNEYGKILENLIDGIVKIVPALIAAFFAYRLWRQKIARERAESIMKGCMMLRHFCIQLKEQMLDDPAKPNSVSIESVNASLEAILIPFSLTNAIDKVLSAHSLWQKGRWFGTSVADDESTKTVQVELIDCISRCDSIVNVLKSKKDSELLIMDFYTL